MENDEINKDYFEEKEISDYSKEELLDLIEELNEALYTDKDVISYSVEFFVSEIRKLNKKLNQIRSDICEKIKKFLYDYDLIKDYQDCAGKDFFEKFLEEINNGKQQ